MGADAQNPADATWAQRKIARLEDEPRDFVVFRVSRQFASSLSAGTRFQKQPLLGSFGGHWQLERSLLHRFANHASLQAAGANANGGVGAVGRGDLHALQVRLELAAGDAGDFGTDATEVLRLTTSLDLVTAAGSFIAEFARVGHRNSPQNQMWCQ